MPVLKNAYKNAYFTGCYRGDFAWTESLIHNIWKYCGTVALDIVALVYLIDAQTAVFLPARKTNSLVIRLCFKYFLRGEY
jgi:hypothetical protein